MFAFDPAGRVTFWNAAMERLIGLTSANVRDRTLRELFPELHGSEEERLQQRALAGHPGRSSAGFLRPLVGASGRAFEVEYAPLSGKDGIAGAFAVLRDMTE